ncbi:MAG: hypothetical protein KatS3mg010_1832 [Acidimicrobiia bacterium]|nr:MAG: hypothetical protein KatS3mg010_1832 [Acidimicrobiia bacterium]
MRDALGIGVATGAYGVSFGAISIAAGLSIAQTCALSALMFTGGSQFALVGSAGSPGAGAATAIMLGARNALYGVRLSPILRVRGVRRLAAAQLVIDESSAMAIAQREARAGRLAFWATGLAVFALWNLGTVAGALGAGALDDPDALGLDAAVPAAFLALLAPRMHGREPWSVAVGGAAVALALTPVAPAGVPVLCAAAVAVVVGLRRAG